MFKLASKSKSCQGNKYSSKVQICENLLKYRNEVFVLRYLPPLVSVCVLFHLLVSLMHQLLPDFSFHQLPGTFMTNRFSAETGLIWKETETQSTNEWTHLSHLTCPTSPVSPHLCELTRESNWRDVFTFRGKQINCCFSFTSFICIRLCDVYY